MPEATLLVGESAATIKGRTTPGIRTGSMRPRQH